MDGKAISEQAAISFQRILTYRRSTLRFLKILVYNFQVKDCENTSDSRKALISGKKDVILAKLVEDSSVYILPHLRDSVGLHLNGVEELLVERRCKARDACTISPVSSISIACLLERFLESATIGVEQNKPI